MHETPLNRRQMGRRLAAGAAALTLGAARLQAEPKRAFALRYMLASSMYGTLKLEDILPEVRKTGAQKIDLWPRWLGPRITKRSGRITDD